MEKVNAVRHGNQDGKRRAGDVEGEREKRKK